MKIETDCILAINLMSVKTIYFTHLVLDISKIWSVAFKIKPLSYLLCFYSRMLTNKTERIILILFWSWIIGLALAIRVFKKLVSLLIKGGYVTQLIQMTEINWIVALLFIWNYGRYLFTASSWHSWFDFKLDILGWVPDQRQFSETH